MPASRGEELMDVLDSSEDEEGGAESPPLGVGTLSLRRHSPPLVGIAISARGSMRIVKTRSSIVRAREDT